MTRTVNWSSRGKHIYYGVIGLEDSYRLRVRYARAFADAAKAK
jgi:hypothetical protein